MKIESPVKLQHLINQKQVALDKVNSEYYNHKSIHFGDNERYSWAVETINKKFKELSGGLIN